MQSSCFLTVVHSFTHVRSSIQDKKVPLLDPGIHTASGARLQHDGGRLGDVSNFQKDGQFECFSTRVQFRNPSCLFFCLAQQGYWSDLRADTGTLFFPDKIQTKHSQTQLHKEESLFFVKGMLVAPLSDEVLEELDDVEEPMLARPATLKDPGTPDQHRDGTAQSDTLSESALVQDVRRISRT